MGIHHFKPKTPSEYKVSSWSGGTTTEIDIYPAFADYSKKEFDFRVSSASIELPESNFTQLPGINRHLMVIDCPENGQVEIVHADEAPKLLKLFETDVFDGGVPSVSRGKCTDFNLMHTDDWIGSLEAVEAGFKYQISREYDIIYSLSDDLVISVTGNEIAYEISIVKHGSLIINRLDEDKMLGITIKSGTTGKCAILANLKSTV